MIYFSVINVLICSKVALALETAASMERLTRPLRSALAASFEDDRDLMQISLCSVFSQLSLTRCGIVASLTALIDVEITEKTSTKMVIWFDGEAMFDRVFILTMETRGVGEYIYGVVRHFDDINSRDLNERSCSLTIIKNNLKLLKKMAILLTTNQIRLSVIDRNLFNY